MAGPFLACTSAFTAIIYRDRLELSTNSAIALTRQAGCITHTGIIDLTGEFAICRRIDRGGE